MARPRLSDSEAAARGSRQVRRGDAGAAEVEEMVGAMPKAFAKLPEARIWRGLVEAGKGVGLWRATDRLLLMDICREQALADHLRTKVTLGGQNAERDDRLLTAAQARLLKLREQAGLTPRSRLRMRGDLERAAEAARGGTQEASGGVSTDFVVPEAFRKQSG